MDRFTHHQRVFYHGALDLLRNRSSNDASIRCRLVLGWVAGQEPILFWAASQCSIFLGMCKYSQAGNFFICAYCLTMVQQGYAAFEPEATLVGHDFYEEAKKIWKEHKDTRTDHICSVAAVQYLSITAVSLGAGTEYLEFHDDLLEMIKRLDLFDIDVSEVSRGETDDGIDWRQVKAQIAWALFNTVTYVNPLEQQPPFSAFLSLFYFTSLFYFLFFSLPPTEMAPSNVEPSAYAFT